MIILCISDPPARDPKYKSDYVFCLLENSRNTIYKSRFTTDQNGGGDPRYKGEGKVGPKVVSAKHPGYTLYSIKVYFGSPLQAIGMMTYLTKFSFTDDQNIIYGLSWVGIGAIDRSAQGTSGGEDSCCLSTPTALIKKILNYDEGTVTFSYIA